MLRVFGVCLFALLNLPTALAQDEIVRLPGQGELKRDAAPPQLGEVERLIPGGGLFVSFDANADGRVSEAELTTGIAEAFIAADRNEDGFLTPLEQISWSEQLPTRDPSLSNPARFDPNLDRRVDAEEFTSVISGFAENLADTETGDIVLASLKSTTRPRREDRDAERQAGRVNGLASARNGSAHRHRLAANGRTCPALRRVPQIHSVPAQRAPRRLRWHRCRQRKS